MVKIKMKLSLIFSMCFLAVLVFGDLDSSTNPNPNSSPSPVENFKALEDKIQELEKSQKELKDWKTSFEKSQLQIKSLKEKVEKLEQGILEMNEDVGMLRPPVRGPPGRKGEGGIKGEMGHRGRTGSHGTPGGKGEKGAVGPPGQTGPKGNSGLADPQSIKNCGDAMKILPFTSQQLSIYPHSITKRVQVLCDFETEGGGWTIIQKRSSGPKQEFNRNWAEYQNGFGSLNGNFWIGLENIRALTQNGDQELSIQLEDFQGNKRWAKYSNFSISSASDFYRLSISGYSGDAGNDMINPSFSSGVMHHGMRFSTPDKDNDKHPSGNCAVNYGGSGWWFNYCSASNLNGLYFEKRESVPRGQGIEWMSWKGEGYSLAKTEMKIRKRK